MEISKTIFKVIIMVITTILVSFIGYKVIDNYFQISKTQKEIDFLTEFQHFLKTSKKSMILSKFNPNLVLICFSNSLSEEKVKELGKEIRYDFNEIKNKVHSFKDEESLKALIETGQKNIFFIYKNGEWDAYRVDNILLSTNTLPLCLEPGKAIKKERYYGKINLIPLRNRERNITQFI